MLNWNTTLVSLPFYCEELMQHSVMTHDQFENKKCKGYMCHYGYFFMELSSTSCRYICRLQRLVVKCGPVLHNKAFQVLNTQTHSETHVFTTLNSKIVDLPIFVDKVVLCF